MFKKIKEIRKMFKGVKNLIIVKCDNCNSINVQLRDETLEYKDIVSSEGNKFKNITYGVVCKNCDSVGYMNETWEIKQ